MTDANDAAPEGAWRAVGPDEVRPGGCRVAMNFATGRPMVFEAKASQSQNCGNGQAPLQATAEPEADASKKLDVSKVVASADDVEADEATQQPLTDTEASQSQNCGNGQAPPQAAAEPDVDAAKKPEPAKAPAGANDADAAESEDAVLARLAALSDVEYEKVRKSKAKDLGFRVGVLDKKVGEARDKAKAAAIESAADDVEEHPEAGFTITSQAPVGERSKPARRPDDDGVIFPEGFTMRASGLWYQPSPDAQGNAPDPLWIAAPFQVRAETNGDADQDFGLLLRWTDPNGREHEWAMPRRMVHAEGNAIAVELEDAGLSCGTSRKAHDGLKHFLGAVGSIHRIRCVERAGWHGTAYVLPNGRVFGPDETNRLVLQSEHAATAGTYLARGTLKEWQEHIARPAMGNCLFGFSLSAGFSGPLLDVIGESSGGVHFYGGSQTGKTTLMCSTASIWGPGDNKTGPMRSWRVTANGLEAVAAEHSDGLLILDEIGQASGREAGDMVYMLANQHGKARMSRAGGMRRPTTWRLTFLSTGETTLATKMSEAGQRSYAGQEVRLLNLAADAGAGFGVFHTLHDAASAGAFADQLRRASVSYCGVAGPAFLEALVRDRTKDSEKLETSLRQGRETFLATNMPAGADGQVRSAAARFALIGMGGELARAYGVVPWPEGEAIGASKACFLLWLAGRGGTGAAEDAHAIETAKTFIALHGAARFENLRQNHSAETLDEYSANQRIVNRAGYVRTVLNKDGQRAKEFLIHAAVWRNEVFKGMNPSRAAMALRNAGFLVPGTQNASTVVWIPGSGEARVYVIRSAILG
jgi:uncharacterized protein (DUF927 family)